MRRTWPVIAALLYSITLIGLTAAHAETMVKAQTFNDWFWNSLDWHSFGSSALAGLIGGSYRTVYSLRSKTPTMRVVQEVIGDAIVALTCGSLVFVLLLAYQALFHQIPHGVSFCIAVLAGFLRISFLDTLDTWAKRMLAAASDATVSALKVWIATREAKSNPNAKDKE